MSYRSFIKQVFPKSIKAFLLLTAVNIASLPSFEQCITTSSLAGGTFTNDNSIGNSNFSAGTLSNASVEDGIRTVASTTLTILGSAETNYLRASNFGFNIPPGATICGVSVWIKKRATGINIFNSVHDEEVKLIVGGNISGTNAANSSSWTGTDAFTAYGGTTDTWGNTLSRDQVNSSDFGVAIAANYSGVVGVLLTAEIDYIIMQISYTPVLVPLIIGNFETKISDQTVIARWTMHEEEDDATMHLQKSSDGRSWKSLVSNKLHYHVGNHYYSYEDKLTAYGKYFYRLELITGTGHRSYSKINLVEYKEETKMVLYPNPSASFVTITNVPLKEKILLFATDGRKIEVPQTNVNGQALIDLRNLGKGTYFIQAGNKIFTVVKGE